MDVIRERRGSWRVKVMKKPGSLAERVMAGEVEGSGPGEDPESGGAIPSDAWRL